jgi:hypothetical protein
MTVKINELIIRAEIAKGKRDNPTTGSSPYTSETNLENVIKKVIVRDKQKTKRER